MSEESGSSAASTGEYNSSIPTGQSISQGGASARSKPCQTSVHIATLADGACGFVVGAGKSLKMLAAPPGLYQQQQIINFIRARCAGHILPAIRFILIA